MDEKWNIITKEKAKQIFLADILRDYPDVNKIYDMFTLACHPDYRGRGIATELVRQALKVKLSTNQSTILDKQCHSASSLQEIRDYKNIKSV